MHIQGYQQYTHWVAPIFLIPVLNFRIWPLSRSGRFSLQVRTAVPNGLQTG